MLVMSMKGRGGFNVVVVVEKIKLLFLEKEEEEAMESIQSG